MKRISVSSLLLIILLVVSLSGCGNENTKAWEDLFFAKPTAANKTLTQATPPGEIQRNSVSSPSVIFLPLIIKGEK